MILGNYKVIVYEVDPETEELSILVGNDSNTSPLFIPESITIKFQANSIPLATMKVSTGAVLKVASKKDMFLSISREEFTSEPGYLNESVNLLRFYFGVKTVAISGTEVEFTGYLLKRNDFLNKYSRFLDKEVASAFNAITDYVKIVDEGLKDKDLGLNVTDGDYIFQFNESNAEIMIKLLRGLSVDGHLFSLNTELDSSYPDLIAKLFSVFYDKNKSYPEIAPDQFSSYSNDYADNDVQRELIGKNCGFIMLDGLKDHFYCKYNKNYYENIMKNIRYTHRFPTQLSAKLPIMSKYNVGDIIILDYDIAQPAVILSTTYYLDKNINSTRYVLGGIDEQGII